MNFSTVPQSHSESQWWAENHPGIRAAGQVIGRPLCVEREAAPVTMRTKRPGLGKWVLAQDVRIWSLHWVHPSREHPFQKKHWATEWTGWVSQLMCASLCPEPPQGLHMDSRREKPQWQRWKLTTGPESRASKGSKELYCGLVPLRGRGGRGTCHTPASLDASPPGFF